MSADNHSDESGKPEAHFEDENSEVHNVRTISRVPGNPNYYEKNGLRTEGDGQDHTTYNTSSIGFIMTVFACSMGLCGSQITPLLYLTLGTTIAIELNAPDLTIWLLTASIVAMGALAPFVGPIADLYGRKNIFLAGLACAIVGCILCGVTQNAAGFIGGQVLLGFGAVTEELIAIAVVSEIVPTAKRSLYAALILCTIIPWSPGTLYANWMATSSWRWIALALGLWKVINFAILAIFYKPPPRVNARGLSRTEMFKRIDFIGGVLLTAGLVFFLVALGWGGQQYPWKSGWVLGFLISGLLLLVIFGLYEMFLAPYPMYPRRIIHAPRPFFALCFVIFAAGINYMPLVVFWPIESIGVFQSDRYQTGVNTIPIGTCILGGAILSAVLLGIFKFKNSATVIMTCFCVMQTVASACLVVIDRTDINTAWAPIILALIGVGGVLVPNQVLITVITPDDLIASVTALTVGLRAQAQVIGLAIFYNRFVFELTKHATENMPKPLIFAGVYENLPTIIEDMMNALTSVSFREYAPSVPELAAATPQQLADVMEAARLTFAQSFPLIYYITIAFGVPACIAAACMGDLSQYMDNHVAVVL